MLLNNNSACEKKHNIGLSNPRSIVMSGMMIGYNEEQGLKNRAMRFNHD